MKYPVTLKYLLPVFTLALLSAPVLAQTAMPVDLSRCAAIANVIERLACFDELAVANTVPASSSIPEPAPVAEVASEAKPAVTVPAAASKAPAQAGTTQTSASGVAAFGQQAATVETGDKGEEALVDTVLEVKQVEPTKQLVTLASGQVWKQSVGKRFIIRPGDQVRITTSGWGKGYRLSVTGKKGFIQVTRLQ